MKTKRSEYGVSILICSIATKSRNYRAIRTYSTRHRIKNRRLSADHRSFGRHKRKAIKAGDCDNSRRDRGRGEPLDAGGLGSVDVTFFDLDLVLSPEQDLWLAVLMMALIDLQRKEGDAKYTLILRKAAKRWIDSKDCEVGAFLWICSEVGIDSTRLLSRIKATDYLSHAPLSKAASKIKRHVDRRKKALVNE